LTILSKIARGAVQSGAAAPAEREPWVFV